MTQQKESKGSHLNQTDRDRIAILHSKGYTQEDIGLAIGRDQSVVSREIARNRRRRSPKGAILPFPGPYEANLAGHKAYVRRKYAKYQGKRINESKELKAYIIDKLRNGWTPDVISGVMKKERTPFYASKTAIYEWLNTSEGDRYKRLLPRGRKGYGKKSKGHGSAAHIPRRKGLKRRPRGAENRTRTGHFEGDTMVSGKKTGSREALSVVYERKLRYLDARKIPCLSPGVMAKAIRDMGQETRIRSISLDNGLENRRHMDMGAPAFFCDPYSSWQKGGVEHAIGMIRRYVPKGADISEYSEKEIRNIIARINSIPRKSLDYATPYEKMVEYGMFKKQKHPSRGYAFRG